MSIPGGFCEQKAKFRRKRERRGRKGGFLPRVRSRGKQKSRIRPLPGRCGDLFPRDAVGRLPPACRTPRRFRGRDGTAKTWRLIRGGRRGQAQKRFFARRGGFRQLLRSLSGTVTSTPWKPSPRISLAGERTTKASGAILRRMSFIS